MFKRNVAQSTNYSNSSIGSNLIKTKQMIHNENGLDLCEDENRCKILEKYILNCNNNHSRDHLDKSHILLNNFASSMGVYKFNHCLDLVQYTTNSSTNNDIETNNAETSDSIIQSIDKQCELDLCEDGNRCKMLEKYFLNSNNNHTRDFLDKSKILLRNFASSMGLYKFNQNMDLIEYTEDLSRNNYMETNKEISTAEIVKLTSNPDDSSLSSILKYPVDRSKVDEVNISTSSYTSDTTTSVDQSASDSSSTTFSQEEDKTLYDQLHGGKLDNRIIELIICLRLYDIRQLTSGNTYTHYNSLFHRLAQDLGICPTDTRSIAELYRLLTYNVRKIRDKINKATCNSNNEFITKKPVCYERIPIIKMEKLKSPDVFFKSMIKPNMLFKISSMSPVYDEEDSLSSKFKGGKSILKVVTEIGNFTKSVSSTIQNAFKPDFPEDIIVPEDDDSLITDNDT